MTRFYKRVLKQKNVNQKVFTLQLKHVWEPLPGQVQTTTSHNHCNQSSIGISLEITFQIFVIEKCQLSHHRNSFY